MAIEFRQWDVFTDRALGGNPLGIFPHAQDMDTEMMQALTREMNLSECTFICGGGDGRYKVRIFTPDREMIFAGHPVVGTAAYIFRNLEPASDEISLELMRDVVSIRRLQHDGQMLSCFTSPPVRWHGELPDRQLAARLCSLAEDKLDPRHATGLLDVGPTYCIVPVRDRDALESACCDITALRELHASTGFDQLTVVCDGGYADGGQFSTRMFAPLHGVMEDAATGSSACCLSEYLALTGRLEGMAGRFIGLDQGYSMHRPSRIWFNVAGGSDNRLIRIAGGALEVASGEFRID
ncbi:PhzF family phenazine biosynthesis protein [bacterium]|nr:PhzF family phenazine biosynthesis protein [bacterium]